MKKTWSKDEINYIKLAYSQGKREKIIAAELDRSAASVNKAITRYKIREKRDYAALDRKTLRRKNPSRTIGPIKRTRLDQTFKGNRCNWTTAEEVLRYLVEKCPAFTIKYRNFTPVYVFHNIEVSLAKVLMEANKSRLEEGTPIFHLDEVTE